MFWLATGVFIIVVGLLGYALFRPRPTAAAHESNAKRDSLLISGGGISTVLILLVVYLFTLYTMSNLSKAEAAEDLVIEVIGHQWWWEISYPDQVVVTANELHLPVGQPVMLHVTSEDVIQSFWVPELHGKIDMIPGRTNKFRLEANQAGEYYGICAEFCGLQHAKMTFLVVAEAQQDFQQWLAQQQQPGSEPTDALAQAGQALFSEGACGQCHAVRGTDAAGRLGPDLTHFGGRRVLASGSLPNTPENLAEWILAPQVIKPGNLMPPTELTDSELESLLAYLEQLK
jgi:cytochrome c oxidase subunit 2